jgi:outer membrane immunogenic protein
MPAQAPYKAAPLTTPFTWQGYYFGVHGGYGWGSHDSFAVVRMTVHPSGGFGGVQAGYNSMIAPNWLLGTEIQLSGGDIGDSVTSTFDTIRSKVDFFGAALARFGYTFDRTLVYAAGGVAWAQNKAAEIGGDFSLTESRVGWAIGGGIEYAIDQRWSAKLEYLHADLGSMRITTSGGDSYSSKLNLNTVKFGVNYRFGEAAPVAAIPVKAMPVASYSWNGSYVGGNVGYMWGDTSVTNPVLGGSSSARARDWSLGIQTGYNWVFAPNLLLGFEADSALLSVDGDGPAGANLKITNAGTVRARLGYVNDRTLIYGTGGLAYAKEKFNGGGAMVNAYQIGWVAGGGIEYMFAPRWSTKIEYLYADYGHTNLNFTNNGDANSSSLKAQSVTVGLNYKFDLGELLRR